MFSSLTADRNSDRSYPLPTHLPFAGLASRMDNLHCLLNLAAGLLSASERARLIIIIARLDLSFTHPLSPFLSLAREDGEGVNEAQVSKLYSMHLHSLRRLA